MSNQEKLDLDKPIPDPESGVHIYIWQSRVGQTLVGPVTHKIFRWPESNQAVNKLTPNVLGLKPEEEVPECEEHTWDHQPGTRRLDLVIVTPAASTVAEPAAPQAAFA